MKQYVMNSAGCLLSFCFISYITGGVLKSQDEEYNKGVIFL